VTVRPVDVAVVGAGPAGMSAALAAREQGASVVVLDEQPAPGGQIYRNVLGASPDRMRLLGPDYAAGEVLARRFRESGVELLAGAAVWQVAPERSVSYLHRGVPQELEATALILCSGALERPMPIPGWTLPGVMTAGAAQILVKSGGIVPATPPVLAGCGPLLYLLATQLLRAGARIAAVVDTSQRSDLLAALPHLPRALRDWRLLAKGWNLLAELRASGVPVYRGAEDIAVEGSTAAQRIRFRSGGRQHTVDTQLVLLHQGVIPNTQFTRALRAWHSWDERQLCWVPERTGDGELRDLQGVFVAGDGARIMGAAASAADGRVAGLAAAKRVSGKTSGSDDTMGAARRQRDVLTAARPFIDTLYPPRCRVPADEVMVCRCEEVTAGEIRRHVRAGCAGPNQLKVFTRCGMGPCQGRQCGITVTEVIAAERGVAPEEVGYQRVRPPIKPITLGELAGIQLAAPRSHLPTR
jgi:NADPH-dependent 2,4-dienoyl-CoA reductase/sulfur reductase-like enzyme